MAQHWTGTFSYITGVTRGGGVGALALVSDELALRQAEHTVPMVYANGKWLRANVEKLDFTTVSMAVAERPLRQAAYLGLHGNVFFFGGGDEHEEIIESPACSPRNIGMLRSIRTICGELYATGMRRQVYTRLGAHRWELVGAPIPRGPGENSVVTSFEAIDGFELNDLYAAGREGEIWHFDGNVWRILPSPTNVILTGVCCAPDGYVYICGRTGALLRGRFDTWQIIDHGVTKQDFWSVVSFTGRIFLSTSYQVFELVDDKLRLVNFGADSPQSCFHLATGPDAMWSVGGKDVMSFDGQAWSRID